MIVHKNIPDKRYRLVWEKWKDPYGENIDDVEWAGWDDGEEQIDNSEVEHAFSEEEEEDSNSGTGPEIVNADPKDPFRKPLRVVATPFGMIPLTEYTMPSRIFNFWVCHTTFSITKPICQLIEKIDGVETLDVFTRYRMKIGIGKAFKDRDVMHNIDRQLYTLLTGKKYDNTKKA